MLEASFNARNTNILARDDPHAIRELSLYVRVIINVWAGIVGNIIAGPYSLNIITVLYKLVYRGSLKMCC